MNKKAYKIEPCLHRTWSGLKKYIDKKYQEEHSNITQCESFARRYKIFVSLKLVCSVLRVVRHCCRFLGANLLPRGPAALSAGVSESLKELSVPFCLVLCMDPAGKPQGNEMVGELKNQQQRPLVHGSGRGAESVGILTLSDGLLDFADKPRDDDGKGKAKPYSGHIVKAQHKRYCRGFSLLEVLVALTLLSLSFVVLVLVQARATKLSVDARNISIATNLARYQLMECKREAQKQIASVGDFELDGDFSDLGYPKFTWDCHAPKFNMKTPSATETESRLKQSVDGNVKGEGGKKASDNLGIQSDLVSPVMAMVTSTLGDSVRELAVIVRWKDGNVADELRVVTHIIDTTAMNGLVRMISQGAQAFGSSGGKDKDKKEPLGGGPPPGGPPLGGPPPGMPGMPGEVEN